MAQFAANYQEISSPGRGTHHDKASAHSARLVQRSSTKHHIPQVRQPPRIPPTRLHESVFSSPELITLMKLMYSIRLEDTEMIKFNATQRGLEILRKRKGTLFQH